MHYLYQRRLNMLEIAIHELSDEQLADAGLQEQLLKDYSVTVPDIDREKLKEDYHEKELAPGEGPEDFRLRKKTKAYYYTAKAGFLNDEFVEDLLPMRVCMEGLSIAKDGLTYTEWSHEPLGKDVPDKQRLRANAEKSFSDVQLTLDEFAANSAEFNQLTLPIAIQEKIQAERLFRFELQALRDEGRPAYSA
ncbi:MAG: hypothetical protein EOO16_11675 [Chitinophagaceae bacterium]|nr:MAG: hypothetical protein EOO16_11675 [Chitinophagaceae bacterium]